MSRLRRHRWREITDLELEERDFAREFICERCERPWTGYPPPNLGCGNPPEWRRSRIFPSEKPIARVGRRGKRLKAKGLLRADLCDFVRGKTCSVNGCHEPGDPAHVRSTGAGFLDWMRLAGRKIEGNVAPLCRSHHDELDQDLHLAGFNRKYRLDLEQIAREWGRRFAREHPVRFDEMRRAA